MGARSLLVVGILGRALVGQEASSQEVRGVESLDGKQTDASLGYGQRHALVIGIDDYQDPAFSDLAHAVRDAEGVAQVLQETLGFPQNNVRVLRNDAASANQLRLALDDWACDRNRVGQHDLMVIFFAGHGVTRDLGLQGKRGYLLPPEGRCGEDGEPVWSSLYSMADLEDVSEAIPCKHALFILDCCFGGLVQNRAPLPIAPGLRSRARQILTAGSEDQTVLDGGGGGHSVFTAELIAAMRGAADVNEDRVLSFGELFEYLARRVETRTEYRQTPLQDFFPDHDGGMIALFPPGVKPGEQSVHERLQAMKRTAEERLAENRLLADVILARDLEEERERLWPRRPSLVPASREWLRRAREFLARGPEHVAALARVREEVFLGQVTSGLLAEGSDAEPTWEKADPEQRFRFNTLRELIDRHEQLLVQLPDMESRMEYAESIEQRTVGDFTGDWDEAINEIALGSAYHGLELAPQVGLVPIGPDPESRLWEFWHFESGSRPERDERGRLKVTGEMGIVLVLIPGGTFLLGSQSHDPAAAHYDPDCQMNEVLQEVTLDPFLMSKYELTQGQWERIMGEGSNPSFYNLSEIPGKSGERHPVEQLSWEECQSALLRVELELPTEAQWECAARGGTGTPWWCGALASSIEEHSAGNVFDAGTLKRDPQAQSWGRHEQWDDGFSIHAPVGSTSANPYGLHEVLGNVWEWTADSYVPTEVDPSAADRASVKSSMRNGRMLRGGCFSHPAFFARSANRDWDAADHRSSALGCRPARRIGTSRD